ncbi:MAG TPA: acyltransferase [bacterium]|nr:acyltransferase [bacterium]
MLEGSTPLTVKQKKMFKYFGVNSKIKPPYRILNPHRIFVGDVTSIQEYCHINAFCDSTFLMDYIDKKYKKGFKAADYLYDSQIHFDRECQIGRFFFASCTASIHIGANVVVSERVFVGDNNHTFAHKQVPIMQQPNQKGKPVEIKKGSWIGVGAAVLKGTRLGVNSVVGANSVVQGVFPDYAVIATPRAQLLGTQKA